MLLFAVCKWPGSYTGLRVWGLPVQKGICYALNKPLILIKHGTSAAFASVGNHSKVMSLKQYLVNRQPATSLLCPAIDARRMEVFTALYDSSFQEIKRHQRNTGWKFFLRDELEKHIIIFPVMEIMKFQQLCNHQMLYSQKSLTRQKMLWRFHISHIVKMVCRYAYCELFYKVLDKKAI